MDIQNFRKKNQIDRKQFVWKVKPHLRQFTLTEQLLGKIETGEITNEDRMADLYQAVNKAYPTANISSPTNYSMMRRHKKLLQGIAFGILVLIVIGMLGLYIVFESHPWTEITLKALGLFATIVTIIGFFLTLPGFKSLK